MLAVGIHYNREEAAERPRARNESHLPNKGCPQELQEYRCVRRQVRTPHLSCGTKWRWKEQFPRRASLRRRLAAEPLLNTLFAIVAALTTCGVALAAIPTILVCVCRFLCLPAREGTMRFGLGRAHRAVLRFRTKNVRSIPQICSARSIISGSSRATSSRAVNQTLPPRQSIDCIW